MLIFSPCGDASKFRQPPTEQILKTFSLSSSIWVRLYELPSSLSSLQSPLMDLLKPWFV